MANMGTVSTTQQTRGLRLIATSKPFMGITRAFRTNSGCLFILPALVIFLVFGLYTVVYSAVLSFFQWNGFGGFNILPPQCIYPACSFVGLQNYQQFLSGDPTLTEFFRQAVINNIVVAIGVTGCTILIALPLATALNQVRRLQALLRSLIILPLITSGIAIFYVWSFIYRSDGLLNAVLSAMGLGGWRVSAGWLGNIHTALPALMVVMIWSAVPLAVLLYLTGLQTIDPNLYEAAALDGASKWDIVRHIIWPLLRPTTGIIIILSVNNSLQQSYEQVYLMTNGAPAGHTNLISLLIYNYGFGDSRMLGVASAMSWVLFLVVFVVALFNVRSLRASA